jgi:hypothetical protein
MIFKYNNFKNKINEELTPEEIEEKKQAVLSTYMRMFLSKRLSDILRLMDSPVAKELLYLSRKNVVFDISFMDVVDKNPGMVTVFQTVRLKRLIDEGIDIKKDRNNYKSSLWNSTLRTQPTKINKIITKLFKGKYTTHDIEIFGNEFKSKSEDQLSNMRIVYGEDIRKWYRAKMYVLKSTLGSSCMRYDESQSYLDIYCKNAPDNGEESHVGMLILTENGKLIGRSIIWFNSVRIKNINGKMIKEPGRVFMDRIYTAYDYVTDVFKDYAKKHNWLYKLRQSYDNSTYIDPKDGSSHKLTLSFYVKPIEYGKYPYMDTLQYYTPEVGRISSKPGKNKTCYKLQSTSGSYTIIN